MMNRLHLPKGCLVAIFGLAAVNLAQAQVIQTDPASGIDIQVTNDFENPPCTGAVPLRVRIRNHSPKDGKWQFNFESPPRGGSSDETRVDLKVEAGQTRTFSIVVPVRPFNGRWMNINASATGPGSPKGMARFSYSAPGSGSNQTAMLAISRELAMRSLEPLRAALDKESWTLNATQFAPGELPEQWRGFSGANWIMLSDREWGILTPGSRNAIRQWVGTGGRLVMMSTNPATVSWTGFRLQGGTGPFPYGFGEVRSLEWNGREVPPETLKPLMTETNFDVALQAPSTWLPVEKLGEMAPERGLILTIVVVLAVALGPVNLFYLAPAGRRHRLFVTTPLLSLGGSALMLVAIILHDGVGGSGRRLTVLQFLPGAHEAVVLQDQVSRNGLLLSGAFTLNEETAIDYVTIGRSLKRRNYTEYPEAGTFALQNGVHSGSWFQSRSLKAHQLTSLRSTRAAITVVGHDASGAPQVVSSFASPLASLALKDADGKWWRGENLKTGERVALSAAAEKDCRALWLVAMEEAHEKSRSLIEKAHGKGKEFGRPNHFYATLATPETETIPTLKSIRWSSRAVALGPVESAPAMTGGGNAQ